VPTIIQPERLATLWRLAWNEGDLLTCTICRDGAILYLRVESSAALILQERFDLQPRAVARAQALRDGLKRRGWHEPGEQDHE
jgi:hypothetical protein